MSAALEPRLRGSAASIGSALAGAEGRARVHSVFRSVLNLEVGGSGILLSLTGPEGDILPFAVALRTETDFETWGLEQGDPGLVEISRIALGEDPSVLVDLSDARTIPTAELASVAATGKAFSLCVEWLAKTQAEKGCELRLSSLSGRENAPTAMGLALSASIGALGKSVLSVAAPYGESPHEAVRRLSKDVASIMGAGSGLTPSGDDFLCGFLAAVRCAAPWEAVHLLPLLCEAVLKNIRATNAISASYLRCAAAGHFALPLAEATKALAEDDAGGALASMARICALGHSSGADIATGFLYGIGLLRGPRKYDDERAA